MMQHIFFFFDALEGRSRFNRKLRLIRENEATEFSTDHFPFHLDDGDGLNLGAALSHNTKMETFHMDVTGMSAAGTTTIATFLKESTSLTNVRLEGDINTQARRRTQLATDRLLKATTQNGHVETIGLVNTYFSLTAFKRLHTNLKNLVLHHVWGTASATTIRGAAKILLQSRLQDLTLKTLRPHVMQPLLEYGVKDHTTIQYLNLGDVTDLDVFLTVRDVLDTNETIQQLAFGHCNFVTESLKAVVEGLITNTHVHALAVIGCVFYGDSIHLFKTLFRSNNSVLKKINMSQSLRSVEMVDAFLSGLHRNSSIDFIDLCNCNFDGQGASMHIGQLLRRNKHLSRLELDRNDGIFDCDSVARALYTNTALTYLDLSHVGLTLEGTIRLARAISENSALTSLFLCANDIEGEGCRHIAHALGVLDSELSYASANTTLKVLFMRGNQIGQEGTEYFASLLRNNHTLKELHLDHCGVNGRGLEALMSSLTANTSLMGLSVRELDMDEEDQSVAPMALANHLPHVNIKKLNFCAGERSVEAISVDLQAKVLEGFNRNTSITSCTVGVYFLNSQTQSHMNYYLRRNQMLPLLSRGNSSIWPYAFRGQGAPVTSAVYTCLNRKPSLMQARRGRKRSRDDVDDEE